MTEDIFDVLRHRIQIALGGTAPFDGLAQLLSRYSDCACLDMSTILPIAAWQAFVVRVAQGGDWHELELPLRTMIAPLYLKHALNLSDEAVVSLGVEGQDVANTSVVGQRCRVGSFMA